jgi:hypothetical protein
MSTVHAHRGFSDTRRQKSQCMGRRVTPLQLARCVFDMLCQEIILIHNALHVGLYVCLINYVDPKVNTAALLVFAQSVKLQ